MILNVAKMLNCQVGQIYQKYLSQGVLVRAVNLGRAILATPADNANGLAEQRPG